MFQDNLKRMVKNGISHLRVELIALDILTELSKTWGMSSYYGKDQIEKD